MNVRLYVVSVEASPTFVSFWPFGACVKFTAGNGRSAVEFLFWSTARVR